MPGTPQLLLFDLGHVIVDVIGERDVRRYLGGEFLNDGTGWPAMEVWDAFEKGLLTPEAFSERFIAETRLATDPRRFLTEFEGWTREMLPGAKETLDALRPRFRLAALSNSNLVHWRRMRLFGIHQQFERAFSSHEIGARKPSRESFEYVLRELGVAASDTAFFDDQPANVEGAKQAGLQAYRVDGVSELRACLIDLGYLQLEAT